MDSNTHSPTINGQGKGKSGPSSIPMTIPSKVPRLLTNVAQTEEEPFDPSKSQSPSKVQAATSAFASRDHLLSVSAADECKQRDNMNCLVTKGGDCIETAHIYPVSLSSTAECSVYTLFWQRLETFWPSEKVKAREKLAIRPNCAVTLESLMSLASTVHDLETLTWTTNDREKRPLTSVELLSMQWNLNRLDALAGEAEMSVKNLDRENLTGWEMPNVAETGQRGVIVEDSVVSTCAISPAGDNRPLPHGQQTQELSREYPRGSWAVPLAKEHAYKTGFSTIYGQYCYLRIGQMDAKSEENRILHQAGDDPGSLM
ncbi:hypothetical protein ASPBRDRAFT_31223 [Aspergillus brasiliensis CBS 101740]|uniref:HNH nuclease domain-containing protein n=1 Tax=Aspergillus brasiliensis (strain CBS 101740 / IMI 381727 / IBT 21946) TaxID=767769 RepID=A0A1L9UF86_ASPBC|nr:hypothetical protein ASPBRDRAFT_31223 [Aspergillus brasiliensis CBS 101740]